jgi:hypothetical protein
MELPAVLETAQSGRHAISLGARLRFCPRLGGDALSRPNKLGRGHPSDCLDGPPAICGSRNCRNRFRRQDSEGYLLPHSVVPGMEMREIA